MSTPNAYFTAADGLPPIFMSYGLLNRLVTIIGEPTQVEAIYTDPTLQAAVVIQVLGKYDDQKQEFVPANPDTIQLSPAVVSDMLAWITEHVLDFFLRSLEKAQKLGNEYAPKLKAFQSSPTGSPG